MPFDGFNVYDAAVDVVSVRRAIGMVFQKPNPFPTMSIFDNVASGLRLTGNRSDLDRKVEAGLSRRRPLGRGLGPVGRAPGVGRPAASSSGSASLARSPWTRRCC